MLKGAFRFTTSLVSKSFRRELDVSVGVVTAGIRGTDIWGKSASDRDFVVLIEGEIGVRRGEEAESTLSRLLTAFVSPHDGLTERQATVSEDELAAWAEETEPQDGEGVVTLDGGWQVNLRSYRTMETAKMAQAGWEDKGYATDVQAVVVAGEKWFRLHVPGFRDRDRRPLLRHPYCRSLDLSLLEVTPPQKKGSDQFIFVQLVKNKSV